MRGTEIHLQLLLVGTHKCDLHIYVCIPGFKPLTIYIYQEGLARFATEKFDLGNLQNDYAHLTNTALTNLGPRMRRSKRQSGVAPSGPSAGSSPIFAARTWTTCSCGRKSTRCSSSRSSPSPRQCPLQGTALSSSDLIF